jgi:glucose-1-phosphate adenylyltransferase
MGGDIVPSFVRAGDAAVYDYSDNEVPGATDRDRGYWRDVGTLSSFHAAHMDVVSPLPVFNLYNYDWPIYTSHGPFPPAKVVDSTVDQALLSPGVVVTGGSVVRSVLSPCAYVDHGAEISDSVLMDGVKIGRGSVVRNAILDKNVVIPPGCNVGIDPEEDLKRGFVVQDGLTVAGKDQPFF